MMRPFSLLIFLSISISAFAQTDTIWYNASWNPTTKKLAKYYRPAPKLVDSGYVIKDYYCSGKLQYKGLAEDPENNISIGTGIWYDEKGRVTDVTHYSTLVKDDVVKTWYPGGNIARSVTYRNWKKNGIANDYYPDGTLAMRTIWKDNLRDGRAISFYRDGLTKSSASFDNGLSDGLYVVVGENRGQLVVRHFDNGIPVGEFLRFNARGDTITNMKYENGLLNGISHDEYRTYALKDGQLHGAYEDRYQDEVITALFDAGNLVRWSEKKGNVVLVEGNARDSKLVEWKYYHEETGTLIAEGHSKYDKPWGKWKFYDDDGTLTTEFNITNSVVPDPKPHVDNISMTIGFGDVYAPYISEYLVRESFPDGITADYIAYDGKGKRVSAGKYVNGSEAGTWKYTKPSGQQLLINHSAKTVDKQALLKFIEIKSIPGANEYDRRVFDPKPWEIIVADFPGGDQEVIAGGLLVALADKHAALREAIVALAKKKLGNKYTNELRQRLQNSFLRFTPPRIVESMETGTFDEQLNTIPIILKKQ